MVCRAEEVVGLENEDHLSRDRVEELGDLRQVHQGIGSDSLQLGRGGEGDREETNAVYSNSTTKLSKVEITIIKGSNYGRTGV